MKLAKYKIFWEKIKKVFSKKEETISTSQIVKNLEKEIAYASYALEKERKKNLVLSAELTDLKEEVQSLQYENSLLKKEEKVTTTYRKLTNFGNIQKTFSAT